MELPDLGPQERSPLVEALLDIVRQVLDRVRELEESNQQLRDEIASLKGQKPRPHLSPNIRCRDTFASLKKTCRKLGVRFWEYLQDRVRGLGQVPRLADLIRQKAQEATVKKVVAVPA